MDHIVVSQRKVLVQKFHGDKYAYLFTRIFREIFLLGINFNMMKLFLNSDY